MSVKTEETPIPEREGPGEREAELFMEMDRHAREGAFPPSADGSNALLDRIKEGR